MRTTKICVRIMTLVSISTMITMMSPMNINLYACILVVYTSVVYTCSIYMCMYIVDIYI